MSDSTQGSPGLSPAKFHEAQGVADWRVTGSGPQAVFRATSLEQAASLVPHVVDAAAQFAVKADIDVRAEAVVVRLPYDEEWTIAATAPAFAAAVSEAAAARGLHADPAANQTVGIYVAQHSEADVRPFFLAALGYAPIGETDAGDPLRCGPQLAFNPIAGDAPKRGRTHFDVFVPADQAKARVEAALAAGGRLVDESHAPDWWTLASPDNHGVDIASWTDTFA